MPGGFLTLGYARRYDGFGASTFVVLGGVRLRPV